MTESRVGQRNPGELTVLHVDDEPHYLDLAKTFLESASDRFVVRTATNADLALEYLQKMSIDCVISDHDMPGTSGLELFQTIRTECPRIPFILMTGRSEDEFIARSIDEGISSYLKKTAGTSTFQLLANRIELVVAKEREAAAHAALSQVVSVVNDVTDRESDAAVAQAVCQSICADCVFEFAWIGRYERERPQSILVLGGATRSQSDCGNLGRVPLAGSSTGVMLRTAIETKELQIEAIRSAGPRWHDQPEDEGSTEWVAAVPIHSGGDSIGVLCISAQNASAFNEITCSAFVSIADILSSSLDRSRMHNQSRQTGVSNV